MMSEGSQLRRPTMRIDHSLRRRALRSAVALLETARDPATVVVKGLPVMEILNDSPLGEITRSRLLQDPSLVALAAERYQGEWPEPERLRAMPPGSPRWWLTSGLEAPRSSPCATRASATARQQTGPDTA